MLSPAAESFFTYFYNALCSLNPFFGCPYELEDKRCALLCFELVKVVLRLGRCHSIFYAYKTSLLTRDTSPTFALFFVSQNFLIFTIYYYRCKNDIIDVFSDENFIGHE